MKILLLYANFIKTPRPTLPIGLAYISAAIKKKGYDVKVVDLCWETKYHVAVINALREYKPDIVAISFRNLDNVTFLDPVSYAPNLKRVIQCCKKYSNAKTIVGGTGLSVQPIELMKYINADFGLIGEGEKTMIQLIEAISHDFGTFNDIPGLVYHKDDEIIANGLGPALNLDENVVLDRTIYKESYYEDITAPDTDTDHLIYEPIETIQGKRGCGLHCSYCIVRKLQGNNISVRSPKLIVEEMKEVMERKPYIKEFEFVDATFNYPYEHAVAVCEEIIRSEIKVKWDCQMSVKYMTPELVNLMERSGCNRVELGTDSLSDIGLKTLCKEYDFDDVLRVDEMLHRSSVSFTHCIFLGAPGEYGDDMRQALDRWKMLQCNQVFGTLGIRVYKNTRLYNQAIKDGIITSEHNPLIPTFYLEPRLLEDMSIFDEIQNHVNSNKNWHLWWALEKSDLKTLVKESLCKISSFENVF